MPPAPFVQIGEVDVAGVGQLDRRELRDNLSPYDAAYVALAEALGSTLRTGDARLAQSPGPTCAIGVLSAAP